MLKIITFENKRGLVESLNESKGCKWYRNLKRKSQVDKGNQNEETGDLDWQNWNNWICKKEIIKKKKKRELKWK